MVAETGVALRERKYNPVEWGKRDVQIKDSSGKVIYDGRGLEFPISWSDTAVKVVSSKYFFKGDEKEGREKSLKDLIGRVSGTLTKRGIHQGVLSPEEAKVFERNLYNMNLYQEQAFNSPVWFNVGLSETYGIHEDSITSSHWAIDENGRFTNQIDAYERPQGAACFIQSIEDNMGDILDHAKREAMLFKFGSGTGTNFGPIRGVNEPLSGGGYASGQTSFMRIYDVIAGSVQSGGKTRRAAKMLVQPCDHPDLMRFIYWKVEEEKKALWLSANSQWGPKSPGDLESEAYKSVTGQNGNNSVRVTDEFMNAALKGEDWSLGFITRNRADQEVDIPLEKYRDDRYLPDKRFIKRLTNKRKIVDAGEVFERVARAAAVTGDPALQYDTTINKWNTCPNSGRINASNPCVTGDTKVLLKEGRWARIDSILGKESNILTNTGIIQESKISGSFKTGIKPVYKLTTKSGFEIKLTADHMVFTINRGFVKAYELTKDDYILLPNCAVAEINEFEDYEFYQLLGIYLGDGGSGKISNTRGISLSMSKKSEIKILEKFSEYVATNYERITHKNSPASVQITKTSAKYVITNTILMNKIAQMVDLSLPSHQKCISDKIFNLSLSEQKFVLQGLFTSDGTVANYGKKSQYISLDSTSLQLLKEVQILLLGFGIKSKIYKNRRAGKSSTLLPDGKGGLKEYKVKEMHSLRISKEGRVKFEKLIGFMPESPKFEKLKRLNENIEVYQDLPIDAVDSLVYLEEEKVYDLTESLTHTFIANGITIHNCSEYMFLDDSSCNLASLNLTKFSDLETIINTGNFEQAVKTSITAQEILVDFASYPSEKIARNSHLFRALGLGYTNLGALLMEKGIAYDSDEGRTIASAVTSLMTAYAYQTSAELASKLGSFKEFEKNREPMLNIVRMHKEETKKIKRIKEVRGLEGLVDKAVEAWERAYQLGEQNGYRNAQVTLLAPTGTIGFMMDVDCTGIESMLGLQTTKGLAGGGELVRIVYPCVKKGLESLGYKGKVLEGIIEYINENGSVIGAPGLDKEHYKVFATSIGNENTISVDGHLGMMAAVQPFLSGAISKTVNLPKGSTIQDIKDTYIKGWKLGLKSISLYVDGSKGIQPVNIIQRKKDEKELKWGERDKPNSPTERIGWNVDIQGTGVHIIVGEYNNRMPTDAPADFFVEFGSAGSEFSAVYTSWAKEASRNRQRGMSLEEFIKHNKGASDPIHGITDHKHIRICSGIQDFAAKLIQLEYLGDVSVCNEKPAEEEIEKLRCNVLAKRRREEHYKSRIKFIDTAMEKGELIDIFPLFEDEAKKGELHAGDIFCTHCGTKTEISGANCRKCPNCFNAGACD